MSFLSQHRKISFLVIVLVFIAGTLYIFSKFFVRVSTPTVSNNFSADLPERKNGGFVIAGDRGASSVQTKDFISSSSQINPQGDRMLTDNDKYSISYINPFRQFFIAFNEVPSQSVRQRAEADLLRLLGISAEDACSLDIHETVPMSEGEEYAGVNFGFSSCPSGKAISQ